MRRLVQEILEKLGKKELRISNDTLEIIQEICELFLTIEFHQARLAQLHAGRITLMAKDMVYIREARHAREGYYICYNEDTTEERTKLREEKAKPVLRPDRSASS